VNKDIKEASVSSAKEVISMEEKKRKAFEDTVVKAPLVAGRHEAYIWLTHVVYSHVQMTCQLLLNYTRHLD